MDKIRRHLTTIVVAFVTASVAAGGTAAVAAVINAKKLNGYSANQLIRVSSKRTTGAIRPAPTATLTTTSIKAPRKGYLVIDASSAIDDSLGAVDGTARVLADARRDEAHHDAFGASASARANSLIVSGMRDQRRVAGRTRERTRSGSSRTIQGSHGSDVRPSNDLNVLYEPFGPDGAVAVPVTPS